MFKSNFLEIEQSQILRFFLSFFYQMKRHQQLKFCWKIRVKFCQKREALSERNWSFRCTEKQKNMVYVVQATVSIEVTLCYYHAVLVILVSFRESVAWHSKEQTFPNCALQIETFWINVLFKIPTVTRQPSWLCTERSRGDDPGQPRTNPVSSRCNMKGLNLGLPDYKPTP